VKPQLFALLTAVAWGVGGYFEKKGLQAGNLSPQVGITVRTAVALVVLSAISWPQFRTLGQADGKAIVTLVIGGGLVAGSLGMLCFYAAIKGAPLNRVMPIAFTSPLFGVLAAVVLGGEALTVKAALGMALTVGGIVLLTA
jgi:transporter family protein